MSNISENERLEVENALRKSRGGMMTEKELSRRITYVLNEPGGINLTSKLILLAQSYADAEVRRVLESIKGQYPMIRDVVTGESVYVSREGLHGLIDTELARLKKRGKEKR